MAKFKVGQKVVRLTNPRHKGSSITKGCERVILDVFTCYCGEEIIDIGEFVPCDYHYSVCESCNERHSKNNVWYSSARHWTLIIEARESFQAVSYEKIFKELVAPVSVN